MITGQARRDIPAAEECLMLTAEPAQAPCSSISELVCSMGLEANVFVRKTGPSRHPNISECPESFAKAASRVAVREVALFVVWVGWLGDDWLSERL